MNALRWIAFLPLTLGAIFIAQTLTGIVAEKLPLWVALLLLLFFGGLVVIAVGAAFFVAPNPKIAAAIVLTLFCAFEIIALIASASHMRGFDLVARVYTDLTILTGGIVAGAAEKKSVT